ncbi:ABC transporter permease subunit [Duganella sp. FT135W]|uniref:ABC transporter permease subunit n=1 Tax=Duganella flavida TaxID=2692175 RepID=A0A6L8KEP4_9BURK|nr:ABC transporter permease subunit [Duganella flavida]MYM24244.1 ABC transporter permease subunit [Duganella flavida]
MKILNNPGRRVVLGIPYSWLLLSSLVPFFIVLKISLSESVLSWTGSSLLMKIDIGNYLFIFGDALYAAAYLNSVKYAFLTMCCCLVLAYPAAYFMARARAELRPVLLMMVMLPFWTSFLLRIYAWKGMLANHGVLNNMLLWLGVIDEPLRMMNTQFSLMVGMVYTYLPFMILPLFANLSKLDLRFIEAAADLGATPWTAFWRVTVPLSKSGIIAGCMLVFVPCIGEFVIPDLLGGPETLMIGHVLWDEFFTNNDWAMASAVTVFLMLLILVPMVIYNRSQNEAKVRA